MTDQPSYWGGQPAVMTDRLPGLLALAHAAGHPRPAEWAIATDIATAGQPMTPALAMDLHGRAVADAREYIAQMVAKRARPVSLAVVALAAAAGHPDPVGFADEAQRGYGLSPTPTAGVADSLVRQAYAAAATLRAFADPVPDQPPPAAVTVCGPDEVDESAGADRCGNCGRRLADEAAQCNVALCTEHEGYMAGAEVLVNVRDVEALSVVLDEAASEHHIWFEHANDESATAILARAVLVYLASLDARPKEPRS